MEEEHVVTPVGLGLNEETLATARTWKFEPVPVRFTVRISFHIQ